MCAVLNWRPKRSRETFYQLIFLLWNKWYLVYFALFELVKKTLKNMSFYLTKASSCEWIRISQKSLCMWNIFERKYVYHLLYWFPYGAACQSTLCGETLLLVQKLEIQSMRLNTFVPKSSIFKIRLKSKFKSSFYDSKSKFWNVLLHTFRWELGLKFTP